MGISHFSGLFVLLCVGVGGALLTLAGEHGFYQLILPHIRRRQNLKYWLHTSQKIHRALNMTYEDVKKQRAEKEKSCNLQKSQPPVVPGAKWNNETSKDATAVNARDFKRVHFNLETLNTRRLLARIATSDAKGGGANAEGDGVNTEGGGPAKPRAGLGSKLCENGGPAAASFAGLVLSLSASSSSAPQLATVAPPHVSVAPPPLSLDRPTATAVTPDQPGELQELQDQIEEMREKLRTALARRAEIQTTLVSPVTMTTAGTMTTTETTASPTPLPTATPATPLPANTKCVTTMTDPPHKVLSKVRPLHSRLANQRR